jgi:hypothetical protein
MSRYYTFVSGSVSGPFRPEELRSILSDELLVCVEGAEEWLKATDVAELAALMVPAVPAASATPHASATPAVQSGSGPGPVAAFAPPERISAHAAVAGSESPPRDLAPKLRELWVICRNASDELLKDQKAKNWKTFFKNEQEIIAAELKRRGLN